MNSLQGNLAREPSPVITRSTRSDGVRTPQPKPGTPRPASTSPAESNNRPLNVTDALGYLDAVKKQFETEPDVYNKFLDIMKDFKGQVIDTPGVIERVSALFHGNVVLIEGFNTFLPAGYRINANADDQTITVTTPMGTTTQSTSGGYTHRMQARDTIPGLGPNIAMPFPGMGPSTNVLPPLSSGPASRSMTPVAYHIPAQPPPSLPPSFEPPPYQNPQTAAAANLLGNLNNRNQVERPQQHAGEFNHAIQYLNKIKSRFVDDSNTYKNFLDILQTYQKEQKQNPHVFVQVQHLFKDAPDLLTEFRLFLPEFAAVESQSTPSWPLPEPAAEKPTKKAPAAPKRKKRGAEKDVTPVPVPKPAARPAKKAKHNHKPEPGSPSSFSGYVGQTPPPVSMPPPTISTFHQSAAAANLPAVIGEKVMFFDRARKALGARDMFDDLLKLLSLFSSEIIGMSTLITLARDSFFGDSDLMQEFKDLVGWEDPEDAADKGPPGSVRTGPPDLASAYVPDDGDGPSYRRLPDSESRLACSGRDELGKSVLNDEWVSHPAWASEDAGFMSHRKNLFEDTLHKSEEERHEYHVHIAAMSRTIAHFEPLAMRLEEMTSEERVNFKLQADFGGSAKALYHRIIRKVYGRDSGLEIIQALQDSPSIAVPVVLARLKQKDDEWRRLQREWGKTWREVDAKNFYKSLDHQGLTFKADDKKRITAKYFVNDIEAAKGAQMRHWARTTPAQLVFNFADTPVLHDSLKMVYSFLDHSQGQYSAAERRSVESFLRRFVPLLCMYPTAEFNAACGPLDGIQEEDLLQLPDPPRSGRRSTGSVHSASHSLNNGAGVAPGDLRRNFCAQSRRINPLQHHVEHLRSRKRLKFG
ncbi:unnamed protein product [Mycena citricolor]|uniref:Histone deacetylase interacting domain-containing protein n=1 Tax=Mycena citricolor TaxID=2018698 RepID=A0AAD2HTT2_9AGAR|nr:unnamed protein product [Mycena citricolor]